MGKHYLLRLKSLTMKVINSIVYVLLGVLVLGSIKCDTVSVLNDEKSSIAGYDDLTPTLSNVSNLKSVRNEKRFLLNNPKPSSSYRIPDGSFKTSRRNLRSSSKIVVPASRKRLLEEVFRAIVFGARGVIRNAERQANNLLHGQPVNSFIKNVLDSSLSQFENIALDNYVVSKN